MPSETRGAFLKNRPPGPPEKLLSNQMFLEVPLARNLFSKSGRRPQPKMLPNRLTRLGTVKKFVFFAHFCMVLIKRFLTTGGINILEFYTGTETEIPRELQTIYLLESCP
jgi:hypothetical protein